MPLPRRLTLVTPQNATRMQVRAKPSAAINPWEQKINFELQAKGLKPGREANMDLIRNALKSGPSGGK
jgi:hypothetical protein